MNGRCTNVMVACAIMAALVGSGMSLDAQAAAPSLEKFTKVSDIVLDKCMPCHTRNYELPFYAKIPGIKQIIEKDYNDGLRAMDLGHEMMAPVKGAPINEVVLAKMEWVSQNKTMPPAKFTAVHWGSRMSEQDYATVLDWVTTSRAELYATKLAAPQYANEPVQPLPSTIPHDAKKATLGEKLYNDTRLSGDNTLSCASCHAFNKGGTDNLQYAEGIHKQFGGINAPTVFNAALNTRQFWDGRAADLQEQAGGPPMNPIEMGSKNWAEIIAKLQADTAFTAAFTAVYPEGWSGDNITEAIAEYEKTLLTPNSRFDKWLKGDNTALNAAEKSGYERFKAYRCASCHVGAAMGGQSFEYVDLKKDYFADRGNITDADLGLQGFTKKAEDLRRFKVSNLRNIALTAPYMHDGTVTSLDEAVRIMGVYLAGFDIPQGDRDLLVSFLRTLTGELDGTPLQGSVVEK